MIAELTNHTWIPQTIIALGGLVASLFAGFVALKAANRAAAAEANSAAAKEQAIETHQRVDGRMEEMLKLVKEQSASEATLKEKEAEASRKATQSAISNGVAAGVAVGAVVGAHDLQKSAADLAKKLVDDAAVVAAKLLAEAGKGKAEP